MSSYQLAVNTSQSDAQISIFKSRELVAEKRWEKAKSHSEVITTHFQELLNETEISLPSISRIYCVNGPGSFTGIRVGVNFCKTLAYSLGCSMVAINGLNLLALNCSDSSKDLISCIDAQKNSVFISKYRHSKNGWQQLKSNLVVKISSLESFIKKNTFVCGDGMDKYKTFMAPALLEQLQSDPGWHRSDLKKYFAPHDFNFEEAVLPWNQIHPLYIKASAAEEKIKPSEI